MNNIATEKITQGNITEDNIDEIASYFEVPMSCHYDWHYFNEDRKTNKLYRLAKELAWNPDFDIEWDQYSPPTATELPEGFRCDWTGFEPFDALDDKGKIRYLNEYSFWVLSNTLHGEQGALLVASQLVSNAPTTAAKMFAASQAFDEARHVEVFNRYIDLRFGRIFPVSKIMKALLDKILTDKHWDIKFVGMQMIIENLALASFHQMRELTYDPVLQDLLSLVIRDEARHVAFGVDYMEKLIKSLPEEEREYRVQFTYEACEAVGQNLKPFDLWKEMGWDLNEANEFFKNTKIYTNFRGTMFNRILPHLRRVGLLTESIKPRYEKLGLLDFDKEERKFEIDWEELEMPLFS